MVGDVMYNMVLSGICFKDENCSIYWNSGYSSITLEVTGLNPDISGGFVIYGNFIFMSLPGW